jgi:hypothetical protein
LLGNHFRGKKGSVRLLSNRANHVDKPFTVPEDESSYRCVPPREDVEEWRPETEMEDVVGKGRATAGMLLALVLTGAQLASMSPVSAASFRCFGKRATSVGSAGADVLTGTRGPDVFVGRGGDDVIEGRGGIDYICGGGGADEIYGGGGIDLIEGGTGDDIVVGQRGVDYLFGDEGDDLLMGMQNDDDYYGGPGLDLVLFFSSPTPVDVDLAAGSAVGEGTDEMDQVEGIVGSDFDDVIQGGQDPDLLAGGLGDDYLDGREGEDLVFHVLSPSAIDVDLLEGVATGGEGADLLSSIEGAFGSSFDDTLAGTSGGDYLNGFEGMDSIDGRGGEDICVGETLFDCPSPDAPADAPLPDEEAPPPPAVLHQSYAPRKESSGDQIGLSGGGRLGRASPQLRTLLEDRALWQAARVSGAATANAAGVTWSSPGYHICWGGNIEAGGPSVVPSGQVAWLPLWVWYPDVGGVNSEWGQWRVASPGSAWMVPGTSYVGNVQNTFNTYVGRLYVYNYIYDYTTGTYSSGWSRWWERNPVTSSFFDTGQYGCRHERGI